MSTSLQIDVFGFPTRIQLSFVLVIGVLGLYPGVTAARLIIWVAVATVSIMWHELGHAFAARRLGAEPAIELYGFGGLTSWRPPSEPTRQQMIGVSLAGPGAGFVLGLVVLGMVAVVGDTGSGDLRFLVLVALWVNLGWGLVNLLPVLPLDGGHVMSELLPGDRPTRARRAALVSIVTGGVAAVALIASGLIFAGFVLGWMIASNVATLNAGKQQQRHAQEMEKGREVIGRLADRQPGALDDAVALVRRQRPNELPLRVAAIEAAAAVGDANAARALLEVPGQSPPALYALVFVVESGGLDGMDELIAIYQREPNILHARWLTLALNRAGRMAELEAILHSADQALGQGVIANAAQLAAGLGHVEVAASLSRR